MSEGILITGATGSIGSFLVDLLIAEDREVQLMTRSHDKAREFRARGIKCFIGDLAAPETLLVALAGAEKLFLLSGADPRQVELQGNMIEAARKAGIRHLVKLSASCAGPDLPTPIKRWHYETEQQIIRSGIPYTFLRPNCFMQNTLKWARTIREKGIFYMPIEDAVVSQIDVRDIAAVAAVVLTSNGHEGQTYELTGREALSFEQVADHLSIVLKKPVRYVGVSFEESCQHMIESGMEEWLAAAVTQTYRFMKDGGAAHVTDVVARLTGSAPISFGEFARDYAVAFQSSPAVVAAL
ncbi:MAG TPA: SDR family oxidoreductase [Pyrinomonadaceae bacterium]|nr:SDR family oxidoreductase [Pyrinomonadaceae bacterium]